LKNTKIFSKNTKFFRVVRNAKISQNGKKCKDFSKWSCCNGRPAQMKICFFEVVKNAKIFQSGEKCEDFSKWFHCYGQPAQMEKV